MIEINLLPEEIQDQRKTYFNLDIGIGKLKILVGAVFAGGLILLLVVMAIGTSVRKKEIIDLTAKEKNMEAQRLVVEAINKEISILKAKTVSLDKVTKREFFWAKKLNELSDLILPGIWFTRITTSDGKLIIEGSAVSEKEEPMASVGKFMENIRSQRSFFEDFKDIKLEIVERKSIYKKDVADFRIALYF